MLPIEEIKSQVHDHLTQTTPKPLIISAPTGSGKSTSLPLWFASMTNKFVLVVEPRRVACRALATYLAGQRGEAVGAHVGYAVRFEERRSAETKVLFVTPGVALRLIDNLPKDHCILIDEFHERGWETDLLAALLFKRFEENPFILGLTSATLDIHALESKLDAQFLTASGRSFPVDIEYLPQGHFHPSREDLDARVASAITHILKTDQSGGDVLVFLPGKGEIRGCRQRLSPLQSKHQLELCEVHSGVPLSSLSGMLGDHSDGKRRVFLATNIAETSLTIPG